MGKPGLCRLIAGLLIFIPLFGDPIEMNADYYRFNDGYVEFWYQVPAVDISSIVTGDTVTKLFRYRFFICSDRGDTVVREGVKGAGVNEERINDCIVDFIPLYLYGGSFAYDFTVISAGIETARRGDLAVVPETVVFYGSDLILSRRGRTSARYVRRGVELFPLIDPQYNGFDTLLAYEEIYGFRPDSLLYEATYRLSDSAGKTVYTRSKKVTKYSRNQVDTILLPLNRFPAGRYRLSEDFYDPALGQRLSRGRGFGIKEELIDIAGLTHYYDIETLVSRDEFRRYTNLPLDRKNMYLKRFWKQRDYREFERRLREADSLFPTVLKRGRDTNQGRYYIENGPPDEIEYRSFEDMAKPAMIWQYHALGLSLLFSDDNEDGNYELVGNLPLDVEIRKELPIEWIK